MAPCVTGSFAISAFNILTPQHSLLLHANADRPVKLHCWAREMESCIISLLHALSVPSQTRRPAAYGGLAAATSVLGLIDEVALIGSSIRSFKEERRGIDSCKGVCAHPFTTYQGPKSGIAVLWLQLEPNSDCRQKHRLLCKLPGKSELLNRLAFFQPLHEVEEGQVFR